MYKLATQYRGKIDQDYPLFFLYNKSNIPGRPESIGSQTKSLSNKSTNKVSKEKYNNVLPILKSNLNNLNIKEKYEIIEEDLISNYFLKKIQLKFNIIFLDPPYREKRLSNIIDNIFQEKILNKDGVIIVHRHKRENDEFSKKFRIIVEKKYGISKIIFGNLN